MAETTSQNGELTGKRVLAIDIGGGSVEFVLSEYCHIFAERQPLPKLIDIASHNGRREHSIALAQEERAVPVGDPKATARSMCRASVSAYFQAIATDGQS